jgi:hypothetical protein
MAHIVRTTRNLHPMPYYPQTEAAAIPDSAPLTDRFSSASTFVSLHPQTTISLVRLPVVIHCLAMALNCLESHLELLPTEIIREVVNNLCTWDITELSCVSRKLRKVCLPSLFRRVKFEFSQSGFDKLQSLLKSDARHHVVSFTYDAPELLKPGKRCLW